jgi:hypothetical protein
MIRVIPIPSKVLLASMAYKIRHVEFEKTIIQGVSRLENSFCGICRQKMPLGRVQKNYLSRRQLALNSHFLSSDKLKIQIQRGRKIVILTF